MGQSRRRSSFELAGAMDILERTYALHRTLSARRYPVSTQHLMDELDCSRSTLHRTLERLRDGFGAPIINSPGRGYFYDPNAERFELPGVWFRADELEALLVMDDLLETVQPGVLRAQIGPLRNKVRGLLDQAVQGREPFPTHRIRILWSSVCRVLTHARKHRKEGKGNRAPGARFGRHEWHRSTP